MKIFFLTDHFERYEQCGLSTKKIPDLKIQIGDFDMF